MARRRRKSSARRRSYGRRRHHRMHGLGQADMSSMMMPAGLGQFDYDPGMSMTTKVVIGAAVVGAAYYFFFRDDKKKDDTAAKTPAAPETPAAPADAGSGGAVPAGLYGRGYFSGLGRLGRGYYSGWQGQGDPGTDFQTDGRGYNYGRYF